MRQADFEDRMARHVRAKLDALAVERDAVSTDPMLNEEGRELRLSQIENTRVIVAEFAKAAAPLFVELNNAGCSILELEALRAGPPPNRDEISAILSAWLPRVSYDPLKREIIAVLAQPWTRPASVRALLMELDSIDPDDDRGSDSIRARLADALDRVLVEADGSEEIVRSLVAKSLDERQGPARMFIITALGKFHTYAHISVPPLLSLLADDELDWAAATALAKLKWQTARAPIEARLERHKRDGDNWVRTKIESALRRLDRSAAH